MDGRTGCAELLIEAGAPMDQKLLRYACYGGHLECLQLLSSYSADLTGKTAVECPWAVFLAMTDGWGGPVRRSMITAWLHRRCCWLDTVPPTCCGGWTPLHHLEVLTAARTRALLRDSASLDALAGTPPVTPLERARELLQEAPAGTAPPGSEAAQLILAAARPWTPATHSLFPTAARARAVELMHIGCQLAARVKTAELTDVWVGPEGVLACAVTRDYTPLPAPA